MKRQKRDNWMFAWKLCCEYIEKGHLKEGHNLALSRCKNIAQSKQSYFKAAFIYATRSTRYYRTILRIASEGRLKYNTRKETP